jgi:PhnB protein
MPFNAGDNYFVSVQCESVQETDKLFAALSEKGKTLQAPQETPWAARFAMFTDQFGTNWMLNFDKPRP